MSEESILKAKLGAIAPSGDLLFDIAKVMPPHLIALAVEVAYLLEDAELRAMVLRILSQIPGAPARIDFGPHQPSVELDAEIGRLHLLRLDQDLFDRLARTSKGVRGTLFRPLLLKIRVAIQPAQVAANGDDEPGHLAMANGDSGVPDEWTTAEPPTAAEPPTVPPVAVSKPGKPKERVVSTGFATPADRDVPLPLKEPLRASSDYLFWLDVGEPVAGSMEETRAVLVPEQQDLKEGDRFKVVVFGFPKELQLDPDRSVGELAYRADGTVGVARQPGAPSPAADTAKDDARMFFPVRTPATPGPQRLRCNIYLRNVLVQSRVVTAWVDQAPARGNALKARADFQLARLLTAKELDAIKEHRLSVQLNANGDASHSFRFASFADGDDIIRNVNLPAMELQDLIEQSRGSLREAAWGSTAPWTKDKPFRYVDGDSGLTNDLFDLMRKGRQLYDTIINPIAGGPDEAFKLLKRMLPPGRLQIVVTGSSNELIPTSLVYDYPNTDPAAGPMTLCPEFVAARTNAAPLEESACFKGECPSIETPQVICPSGFWGYRHAIGIPVASKYGPSVPLASSFTGSPRLGMCFYRGFDLVADHRKAIAEAVPAWEMLEPADSYAETVALIRSPSRPHVIYFYCHGGVANGVPFLEIEPDPDHTLSSQSMRWPDPERYRLPRPLVIINGCETVALEPARAMNLVSAFVDQIAASGVIGTEITVSEELASRFGALLLQHIRDEMEVGEAVRIARLALLKEGNPLGLVYLPLIASDARLMAV